MFVHTKTKVSLTFCNVQVLTTSGWNPHHHELSAYFLLKKQELRLVFAILLEILFDISWPQQFESLFALGRMWAVSRIRR